MLVSVNPPFPSNDRWEAWRYARLREAKEGGRRVLRAASLQRGYSWAVGGNREPTSMDIQRQITEAMDLEAAADADRWRVLARQLGVSPGRLAYEWLMLVETRLG